MEKDSWYFLLLEKHPDVVSDITEAISDIAETEPTMVPILRNAFTDIANGLEALSMMEHDLLYLFCDKNAQVLKEAAKYAYNAVCEWC